MIFEPGKIDLVDLLRWFWEAHDPTQHMGQGNDHGTQYRSGLYYFSEDQRKLFEASRQAYQAGYVGNGLSLGRMPFERRESRELLGGMARNLGRVEEISTEIKAAADYPEIFYYAEATECPDA